jgi:hypothetical protein
MSYTNLPDFPEAFQQYYHYSLDDFFQVSNALLEITYHKDMSTAIESKDRLEKLISQKTKLPKSRFIPILTRLTYNGDKPQIKFPIIPLGKYLITSHFKAVLSYSHHIETCFDEQYEPGLKGPAFEQHCREIIQQHGFYIAPDSIEFKESYLSPQVSIELWGKEKQGSDLDVLAVSDKLLLLLEAKERKLSKRKIRKHVSTKNQMIKFSIDLKWKALWLSQNWSYFTNQYLDEDLKTYFADVETLLPLLVSTYVEDKLEGPPPAITIKELPSLLKHIEKMNWQSISPIQNTQITLAGIKLNLEFLNIVK